MRILTAIPVYNEAAHLAGVLREVRRYSPEILVVNDGSTDGTGDLLAQENGLHVLAHSRNRGYGAALSSAFAFALAHGADVLVTMDCDGQHEPARIPVLLEAIHDADIVSGSRYLRDFRQDSDAPRDRQEINRQITQELNARFGLNLTDSFCGFKAYRREALAHLRIAEPGTGWCGVLFVFGRARRELEPGFYWMVPFVWTVRKVPVRSVTFTTPLQVVTTADGLVYEVQANLVYRIAEPTRSVVQIGDLRAGLTALVPTVVQGLMQGQTRASLIERDPLEKEFTARAGESLARWGMRIEQAGFTTIAPTKKTLRLTQLARRLFEREQVWERYIAEGLAPETALRLLGADRRLVGHAAHRYQKGARRRRSLMREFHKQLARAKAAGVTQRVEVGRLQTHVEGDGEYHPDAERSSRLNEGNRSLPGGI